MAQKPDAVGVRDRELERVFDRDDALGFRNMLGKRVQNRGFAASGSADDEDIHFSDHAGFEKLRDLRVHHFELDEIVERKPLESGIFGS